MADWIYCGTDPPVNADGTQGLLRTHQAIWCRPPGLHPWPGFPADGDQIWLVWRNEAGGPILLLGGGRLVANTQPRYGTNLLHTNSDIPGVRDEAEQLGYGGGLGMSFLQVQDIAFPGVGHPVVADLGVIPNALSEASEAQRAILDGMLRV
jgi:hypothetical protein